MLIKGLTLKIRDCHDGPDEVSWGCQIGILISKNDAKGILEIVADLQTQLTYERQRRDAAERVIGEHVYAGFDFDIFYKEWQEIVNQQPKP